MKKIRFVPIILLFLLSCSFVFGQSNYVRGFKVGYINGYCFDVEASCRFSVPETKGNFGKFRDGYAAGFEKALKERKDINYKQYFRDYTRVMDDIKTLYVTSADVNALTKAMEKAHYYYLIGDYERSISLIDLLSRNLENEYRLNMYKGLSLIELGDYKQGQKFLKWALRDMNDESEKEKIDAIVRQLSDGSFQNEKRAEQAQLLGIKEIVTPKPEKSAAKKEETILKETETGVTNTAPTKTTNAFFENGKAKYAKQDYAGAIADFTKAIDEKAPQQAYYLRALAKEKMSDTYGAAKDLEYLVTNPVKDESFNFPEAALHYGNILLKQKKYSDLLKQMDALIKLNDKTTLPVAYYNRGVARINTGDKDGGCADLSKSGELGHKKAYEEIQRNCR